MGCKFRRFRLFQSLQILLESLICEGPKASSVLSVNSCRLEVTIMLDNLKLETFARGLKVEGETSNLKLETRNPKLETRNSKL